MSRWKVIAAFLGVFGAGYLVCRVADWVVHSEEEKIVEMLAEGVARARERDLDGLMKYIDLSRFGLSARGYGVNETYAAGDEPKILAKAREASGWVSLSTLQLAADEDEVKVDGDRARTEVQFIFEEDGRKWRQPARLELRKADGRWFVTEFELLSPDQALHL